MWSIITTWWSKCDPYIWFTTSSVTVSYQYVSDLCYFEIRLLRLSASIELWSTHNTWFYYVLVFIVTKNVLYNKLGINSFVIFCNTIIWCIQVILVPIKSVDLQHKANMDTREFIIDRFIVVKDIVTLIKIVCHQQYKAIQYFYQLVLAIALDLNMTYISIWLLVYFENRPGTV